MNTYHELRALVQALRNGDWNLRAPQELADTVANLIETWIGYGKYAAASDDADEAFYTCAEELGNALLARTQAVVRANLPSVRTASPAEGWMGEAFGRDDGADWYAENGSVHVDFDRDPKRQLSLILKADGKVGWAIYNDGGKWHGDDALGSFATILAILTQSPATWTTVGSAPITGASPADSPEVDDGD